MKTIKKDFFYYWNIMFWWSFELLRILCKTVTRTKVMVLNTVVQMLPEWVTPNGLSKFRIVAAVILWPLYLFDPVFAFGLYFVACLTDAVDGHLARVRDLCSDEGKRLDELADKIFAGSVALMLLTWSIIPDAVFELSLSCIVVIALREAWMTYRRFTLPKKAKKIPPLTSARAKTVLLMLALGLLMMSGVDWMYVAYIAQSGTALLMFAMFCALWSCFRYECLFREVKI